MADETNIPAPVLSFDMLTTDGKLSAIYTQVLHVGTKVNDALARLAQIEIALKIGQ